MCARAGFGEAARVQTRVLAGTKLRPESAPLSRTPGAAVIGRSKRPQHHSFAPQHLVQVLQHQAHPPQPSQHPRCCLQADASLASTKLDRYPLPDGQYWLVLLLDASVVEQRRQWQTQQGRRLEDSQLGPQWRAAAQRASLPKSSEAPEGQTRGEATQAISDSRSVRPGRVWQAARGQTRVPAGT